MFKRILVIMLAFMNIHCDSSTQNLDLPHLGPVSKLDYHGNNDYPDGTIPFDDISFTIVPNGANFTAHVYKAGTQPANLTIQISASETLVFAFLQSLFVGNIPIGSNPPNGVGYGDKELKVDYSSGNEDSYRFPVVLPQVDSSSFETLAQFIISKI